MNKNGDSRHLCLFLILEEMPSVLHHWVYCYLWVSHIWSLLCWGGEGNGNPLQCSCLENPRDSRAWWAAVYGVTQSWTWLMQLSSSSSRVCLCPLSKEHFHKRILNFIKSFFCIYWDDIVFILQFVNVVYHTDWLADTEKSLPPWGKPNGSWCKILLTYYWICLASILLIFLSMFFSDNWPGAFSESKKN